MKIATPISSLFANREQAEAIIAASDCLECRDHGPGGDWPSEELFHTDIQPIHHVTKEEWGRLRKISETKPQLKVLSMHLAACCDKPLLVKGRFESGGKVCSRRELLDTAACNLARIREIFGGGVQIAVENNNYYPTPAYRFVCDADFIKEIVQESQLRFLLDLAHAHITSVNQGIDYQTYLEGLPMESLIQIHLCKHGIRDDGSAYDAHELPGAEEFEEVQHIAKDCQLQYLTIEYYNSAQRLVSSLVRAQTIKNEITRAVV